RAAARRAAIAGLAREPTTAVRRRVAGRPARLRAAEITRPASQAELAGAACAARVPSRAADDVAPWDHGVVARAVEASGVPGRVAVAARASRDRGERDGRGQEQERGCEAKRAREGHIGASLAPSLTRARRRAGWERARESLRTSCARSSGATPSGDEIGRASCSER